MHVTLRVRPEVGRLDEERTFHAIAEAFRAAKERFGFRLVHYAVQRDHLHLTVEAKDRGALRRGVQGLAIRVIRGVGGGAARGSCRSGRSGGGTWGRSGSPF